MKFDDLNKNLNEGPISGPAGFAARTKAKLQKNIPFAKQQRRRGEAKDELFKKAKVIKDDFKAWVDTKYGSSDIDRAKITMSVFLEWMASEADVGNGAEEFARGDENYAEFFKDEEQKPEQGELDLQQGSGEVNQTSTDNNSKEIPPGKVSNSPPEEISDEDKKAGYDKTYSAAEEESRDLNPDDTGIEGDGTKQDVTASKGDDKEPKVDTSASIYESRLRAFLTEDEEAAKAEIPTLKDNQIDTIIVGALRKSLSGLGKSSKADDSSEISDKVDNAVDKGEISPEKGEKIKAKAASKEDSGEGSSSSGISLDKSDAKNTKNLLKKSIAGQEFDDKDRKVAEKIINYLNKYV